MFTQSSQKTKELFPELNWVSIDIQSDVAIMEPGIPYMAWLAQNVASWDHKNASVLCVGSSKQDRFLSHVV